MGTILERVSTFTTAIQQIFGSSSHNKQTRKRNKRHPNWKRGNETVIVCRWHHSEHRKPYGFHLKTTPSNEWILQAVVYKLNTQKLKAFLYTNKEISEAEIREGNPIYYSNKKNKILRSKFSQGGTRNELKLQNTEEKIKEDTNKWKHISRSWIGRFNIIKMSITSKAIKD